MNSQLRFELTFAQYVADGSQKNLSIKKALITVRARKSKSTRKDKLSI